MPNHSPHTSRIVSLFVAFVSLIGILHPASAQAATQVRFSPTEVLVPLNGTAQVAVEVVDVQALYGFDIALTFDPAVIEVVGAKPDQKAEAALGTFMEAGFMVMNKVDNTAGTLRFVMTQLNPSKPKDGTGVLIVFNVRGKKEGATSALKFTKTDMARRDGTSFDNTPVNGQVKVVSASQALPAASPIPTQDAGTAMPAATASATQAAPAATQLPIPTQPPATPQQPQDGLSNPTMPVGLGVIGLILLVAVLAVAFILLRKRK